jgi:hypothetical protein
MTAIVCVPWIALVWAGRDIIRGAASQRISDFPNHGQITYYLGVPIAVVVVLLAFAAILNRLGRLPELLVILSGCMFLSLLPYLMGYTGGV